jgi:hypothetical protein
MNIQNLKLKYEQEKDFDSMFLLMDSHDRLPWLIQNYNTLYTDCDEETYYRLVGESLVLTDNQELYRIYYPYMVHRGNNPHHMMNPQEKKEFEQLPDTLIIYRGVSSDTPVTTENVNRLIGNSWTLKREVSEWFSKNHSKKYTGEKYTYVLKYEIPKTDVWSYFTERNEDEIFLDSSKIDPSRVIIERVF